MIRLLAGIRLSKMLFTDEKIFTVAPLHNQNGQQSYSGNASRRLQQQKSSAEVTIQLRL